MNPSARIMQIVIGLIGLPSRSNRMDEEEVDEPPPSCIAYWLGLRGTTVELPFLFLLLIPAET
ncbi:hypothetical protein SESBI_06177 [Sesbania bispinosa]|nr:hypothetical protein SESBI_06177 [Sesbania bispinosa]